MSGIVRESNKSLLNESHEKFEKQRDYKIQKWHKILDSIDFKQEDRKSDRLYE